MESHAAQIEITIRAPGDTPPARIVHRHAQAMAALGEFARVIAVCWPEAPRLTRPPQDPMPGESAIDPTRSCVAFRDARPSGASPEASGHVCDSIGLHAFGLPDVEVATDGPPAKETTALLYDLARRIFRAGATLETEALLTVTECGQWSIQEARSTLAPERDVLRVTARMQASTDPAES